LALLYKAANALHSAAGIWVCAAHVVKVPVNGFAKTAWGGSARKLPAMTTTKDTHTIR
jgi:hypothetical protein